MGSLDGFGEKEEDTKKDTLTKQVYIIIVTCSYDVVQHFSMVEFFYYCSSNDSYWNLKEELFFENNGKFLSSIFLKEWLGVMKTMPSEC